MKQKYLKKILLSLFIISFFCHQSSASEHYDHDLEMAIALSKIEHHQGVFHPSTSIHQVFQGNNEDTLFYVQDNQLEHYYGYDDHAVVRENSSGKENCCFLFSIIGNNEDLLTKVMGYGETSKGDQAKKILSNPELPDTCDEDAHRAGLIRRDFTPVKQKFMNDVIWARDNPDRKFFLSNGEETTFRNFVDRIVRIHGMDYTPEAIRDNPKDIPVEYTTLFSVLYGTPVVPLHKQNNGSPTLMNPLIRAKGFGQHLMPAFSKDEWRKAILIYHSGGHYQKLHALD